MNQNPVTPTNSLEINASRQFTPWLLEQNLSLAFTTYQAGKLFFIGLQPSGKLSVFERTFERCMGLYACGSSLYMSSLYQLWRFENILQPGQVHDNYDAVYLPQISYVTGDLDIHDIALSNAPFPNGKIPSGGLNESENLIFVNTLFSCLAKVSSTHSFIPLWQPPFISKLAAEDRCHFNGLAMRDGQPRYVTVVSQSDAAEGWRDRRADGGCVIDVTCNEIVIKGLSMPHSPRWYRDKLWLLNSGTGDFGYVDLERGSFEPVAFCPGYMRGCAFHGNFAIVGISQPRHNKTFSGLPLDEKLQQKNVEPRCGLLVIDLRTGDIVHSLRIEGAVLELYDVVALPGVRRPMAIGFKSDEIRRMVTMG
ncbi:MAG: TIGR03032 family protein [Nostoc sp. NMS1]|uniref:TIGR03032 family protein n=1 Tax=unclassified Nostoc TaxID=2593658 RepID=UPI0025CD9855|nr:MULTISPECIES: TIGR03032 family protein [unclassified Nostoc]MBN3905669.1 TIGR03032 family protein [Nostoc sp. NMS1]MBN3991122.1 TIGR03032 family protein [Nostoc sp. NMS2]